jgi:allantoinase
MTVMDKVFKNGKIVTPLGLVEGDLGIKGGLITSISKPSHTPEAQDTLDIKGMTVFPGFIDNHVHFGGGLTDPKREDYITGTKAAASSGVTSISDMPTGDPGAINIRLLKEKIAYAEKHAYIDFALYGGAGATNIDDLKPMIDAGIVAFKTYMIGNGGFMCKEDQKILKILKIAAENKVVTGWHAENIDLINPLINELKEAGRVDPMAHIESRPPYTEYEAISSLIQLNRVANAPLHIIHLSTKIGLEMVRAAKAEGMNITAETCPHYLLLNYDYMKKVGPYGKFIPPMRAEEDKLALWSGINDGTIDYICSDHAPHTKESKDAGWENIWLSGNGNPGLETIVPLMLDQVNKGRLSIQQLALLLSTRPAKLFKLYPKKGIITLGSDADLTIVDMKKEWAIKAEYMYSKSAETTIYEGWEVKGKPMLTVVRGEVVSENGEIVGKMGYGRYQKRLTNP